MPLPRVRTFPSINFLVTYHHRPSPTQKKTTPTRTTSLLQPAAPFSASASVRYAFSRSTGEPTHYEILDVPVTASTAEIKKKFYTLSMQHHPDRNRNDPSASTRFARIASAYDILSNPTKRSTYDRDHNIFASYHSNSTHSTANPGQHPMGSHSSYSANLHSKNASYAGSRPASGLSKRRGPFRGPPPSFYAHGGYGATAGRRTQQQQQQQQQQPSGYNYSDGGEFSSSGAAGSGMGGGRRKWGDEDDPTAFIDRNPLWHFNARGHFRTQEAEDARRKQRRSKEMDDINEKYIGGAGDFAVRFVLVVGTLVAAGAMTGFFVSTNESGKVKVATSSSTSTPTPTPTPTTRLREKQT